jgi:ADP-ribosyl-[dinitrogen reductase] hydrolase
VIDEQNRYRGSILGLAVGDAVGAAVEGMSRGSFAPVEGIRGGGPFGLAPGQWTDDTATAWCLAESLIERQAFDAKDQMDRYVRWWREGYRSSTGTCVGIRVAMRGSLETYVATGDPLPRPVGPRTAGNHCLGRLAPIVLFYAAEREGAVMYAGLSPRTTHGTRECIDACRLLGDMIWLAVSGAPRERVLLQHSKKLVKEPKVRAVARGDWQRKDAARLRGSGHVVDCLEAAVWSFGTTGSFAEAVLRAANLGDDAAATAAVCGQIAGAYYGAGAIPPSWLRVLSQRRELERVADRLLVAATSVRHARRPPAIEAGAA